MSVYSSQDIISFLFTAINSKWKKITDIDQRSVTHIYIYIYIWHVFVRTHPSHHSLFLFLLKYSTVYAFACVIHPK